MDDLISRQAAIDALAVGKKALSRVLDEIDVVGTDREKYSWGLGLIESSIKDIEELPSAQPEPHYDEWCDDCKEYDKERHCCPRWNRVIRQTLKDAQPEQRWIPCSERLPEDVEIGQEYPTVIYSTSGGEVAAGWYEVLTQTWWRESASGDVIKDEVIAWMSLPEPWKGEGE